MSQESPQAATPPPGAPRPNPLKSPRVRTVLLLGGAAVLVVGLVIGFGWWTHGRFVQGTNDAYLQADQMTVSPRVQGYVDQVLVGDNQDVAAGQPLVHIEGRTYKAALDQQLATVDARKADVETALRQIEQQQASIDQSRAQLSGAQDTATYASGEAARYADLSAKGVETVEKSAQVANQRDQALATEHVDTAALKAAQRQVDTLKAQSGQARAQLEAAQAEVASDQQNLSDTLIKASIAGRVGDRAVRVGQYVAPGTRLMTIVPVDQVYLVANFKETQIGRMRRGQPAKIKVDALGGRTLDGVVDSFSPGTGSQFALLPAQNATGNFTKIVQRVPVKIHIAAGPETRKVLLPGLSVNVDVDTRSARDTAQRIERENGRG